MTNSEIITMYDSNMNMTLLQLSRISGRSIPDLKKLLMSNRPPVEESIPELDELFGMGKQAKLRIT